jgi:putative DNA primase/helicase
VSDPNSGLFRRVKVISFPVIPESKRDPRLKETIKTEGAGILNWALKGLDKLQKRGRFEIPQAVKAATEGFRQNNDIPARFVEDCCLTGNDSQGKPFKTPSSQLYSQYKAWCIETGHKPQSSTSVAREWKRLGFHQVRSSAGVAWEGVGIRQVV